MKSRDHRRISIPPEGSIAGARVRDYTSDRSVAVLQGLSGPTPSCGSATCVDLNGRWFLATAAHNINDISNDADIRLVPRAERGHPGLPFLRRSHPRSSAYELDVAWIEVDPLTARRGGLLAVPRDQLRPVTDNGAFFIQGYPSGEVEQSASGGFDPLSLCVLVVSLQAAPSGDIALEYPPNSPVDVGLELIHPRGFSGGGVWTFTGLGVWPYVNIEKEALAGIITEYEASAGRLNSVSITGWLQLVAMDNPDLAALLVT